MKRGRFNNQSLVVMVAFAVAEFLSKGAVYMQKFLSAHNINKPLKPLTVSVYIKHITRKNRTPLRACACRNEQILKTFAIRGDHEGEQQPTTTSEDATRTRTTMTSTRFTKTNMTSEVRIALCEHKKKHSSHTQADLNKWLQETRNVSVSHRTIFLTLKRSAETLYIKKDVNRASKWQRNVKIPLIRYSFVPVVPCISGPGEFFR